MSATPIENVREGAEVSVYVTATFDEAQMCQCTTGVITRITPTMITIDSLCAQTVVTQKIKKNKINLIEVDDDSKCDEYAERKRVAKADHRRALDNIKKINRGTANNKEWIDRYNAAVPDAEKIKNLVNTLLSEYEPTIQNGVIGGYAGGKDKYTRPLLCAVPCVTRPMLGYSWWKMLGYGTDCGCAWKALEEETTKKITHFEKENIARIK